PSAMDMTPVNAPTGGAWTDLGQVSLGSSDTLVLSSGNYYNSGTTATKKNFKMTGSATVIVSGDVVLKVANKFWMTGTSEILVTPGSSLTVYVEGNIDLSGSGIVNTSSIPANVQIYGGANTTDCDITGSVEFFGVVFAPNAQVRLTGTTDIYGSIVGRTVSMTGGGTLHYDEALANLGGSGSSGSITIVSWREI
ncbi:MAG: hypothetical protein JW884_08300, partial [Deltaproteobacteria bacterium]|nr:hypothetical protein [Deltaproteobacteria bacterium]